MSTTPHAPQTLGDDEDETPTSGGFTPFDQFDNTDTDPSLEEVALFGRSASGLPLDPAGQEWDVVSADGHGFNDSDGPAQMRGPDQSFKPDWGPLVDRDVKHFFECSAALDAARAQGQAMYDVALNSFRLRNENQWQRVQYTFYRQFSAGDDRFAPLAAVFGSLEK